MNESIYKSFTLPDGETKLIKILPNGEIELIRGKKMERVADILNKLSIIEEKLNLIDEIINKMAKHEKV